MRYKHTVNLIHFLRKTYGMCERTIYSPKILFGIDVGTGSLTEISDAIDGDSEDDVIGNLYRGHSKYLSGPHIDGRFPLTFEEMDGFYKILNSIANNVKLGNDSKTLCDSMVDYIRSTEFYMKQQ